MTEELLKIVDSLEAFDETPSRFTTALACDLLWKMNAIDASISESEREERQRTFVRLYQHIYTSYEDPRSFQKKVEKRGMRHFFSLTPFYESSSSLLKEVLKLEKERKQFKVEYDLIRLYNRATENMMNSGVRKWQQMTKKVLFDQWRLKTRVGKKFRTYKARLTERIQRAMISRSRKEYFLKWRRITRQNHYGQKFKMLRALEENVASRQSDKTELQREVRELEMRLKALKLRRPMFQGRSDKLRENLVASYEEEMHVRGNIQIMNLLHRTRRDAIHDVGSRVNSAEASHLVDYTSGLHLDYLKSLQIRFDFADDIDKAFGSLRTWIDIFADRLRDIFCYYAKYDGVARTMSENEFETLLRDARVFEEPEKSSTTTRTTTTGSTSATLRNISSVRRHAIDVQVSKDTFRSVTIHHAQFVEGHCVLTPNTYVEALLRVACEAYFGTPRDRMRRRLAGKYNDGEETKLDDRTMSQCFVALCEKDLFTHCMRHDADGFRRLVYESANIQDAILENRDVLVRIFLHYATHRTSRGDAAIGKDDFVRLVTHANLIKFGFTHEIVSDIFCGIQHRAKMSAEEAEKNRMMPALEVEEDTYACFEEFVEGIASCACYRFPNPYEPLHIKFKMLLADIVRLEKGKGSLWSSHPSREEVDRYARGFFRISPGAGGAS
eukprot:g1641.t1